MIKNNVMRYVSLTMMVALLLGLVSLLPEHGILETQPTSQSSAHEPVSAVRVVSQEHHLEN